MRTRGNAQPTILLQTKVPKKIYDAVVRAAEKEGISISAYLRRMLIKWKEAVEAGR